MQAAIRLEHALLAVESEHELNAMLELAAPDPPDSAERPPLRLDGGRLRGASCPRPTLLRRSASSMTSAPATT